MKVKREIGFVALAGLGLMAFASSRADAATISFFANGSYVDMSREGPNLRSTLVGLGHTVVDFTGITAADFGAATAGGQILVFPEMEIGNLYDDLDGAARSALSSFVSGGGGFIQANYYPGNSNLANGLFGYGLVQTGSIGDTSLDAGAAAGTPWAGGPLTLPGSNAVEGVLSSSLPLGALDLYHDGFNTSVFATVFGSGTYVYLGFDWFEEPTPEEWALVTGAAVDFSSSAAAVPEPASLVLLGSGLALVACLRRRTV